MKKSLILISAAFIMSAGVANAATTSCLDMGKQVEAAMKTAKLTAADKTTAEADITKAADLCKAKKEADSNKQYETVMKLLKK